MTSPKSPAAEPGFVPEVGQMCEGEGIYKRHAGKFKRWSDDSLPGYAVLLDEFGAWGFVTRSSLRPLATPAASEETIPDDVAALLKAARKSVPDAVVTKDGGDMLVVWAPGIEHGWIVDGHRDPVFDTKELLGDEGGYDRDELRQSIHAKRAWPLEDAKRLARFDTQKTPPAASEEFYGTMPRDDELPATIPAGVRFSSRELDGYITTGAAKLNHDRQCYELHGYRYGSHVTTSRAGIAWVRNIDWSTVPKRPPPQPVPAADGPGIVELDGTTRDETPEERQRRLGGQSHPSEAWGIPRSKRPITTCNEPGCNCPYCLHRPFSPKLAANDQRYNGGKGPAYSTIDASIAAARGADERKAHPESWPSQFSGPGWEE